MVLRHRKTLFIAVTTIVVFVALSGCSKSPDNKGRVIATINGENIYTSDFNRALALTFKRDPMFKVTPDTLKDQINVIIDKRLLVGEARRLKLDRTPRFIETIKTFWEQTLIRDLMGRKNRDIGKEVEISEDEVRDYYEKLSHRKTFMVVGNEKEDLLLRIKDMQDPGSVRWDDTIGPVSYDKAETGLLAMVFGLPEGEMAVVKGKTKYYLVYARKDEVVKMPPLSEIRSDIEKKISIVRRKRSFVEWLEGLHSGADIKINEKLLNNFEFKYEQ